jgi:hypothetical protein
MSRTKDFLRDTGTAIAHGIVDAGEAVAGLGNIATRGGLGWALNKAGYDPQATHEFIDSFYTPQTRQAMQAVENAKGFGGTLAAVRDNPNALGYGALRQLPSSVGGGLLGKAAIKPALAYAGKQAAKASAARKTTRNAGRIILEKAEPYQPGLKVALAANAIGKGVVGTGQGAEEIRQEAPTAPWSMAKTGQAIMRGVGEGTIAAMTGFGIPGGGPVRTVGKTAGRQAATELIEYAPVRALENTNREQARRDYTSPTDMLM